MIKLSRNSVGSYFWRGSAIAVNVAALITLVGLTVQFGTSQDNAARARNALIAEIGEDKDFHWFPDDPPADYLSENSAAHAEIEAIVEVVLQMNTATDMTNFEKARSLAAHLISNKHQQGAIQSDAVTAYRQIVTDGRGYCADYSQVFTALALAGKIPVREWGLAWEAFGPGHTFNEVFDSTLGKWVFIDSFYSAYVVDEATGMPMSALEFQTILRDQSKRAGVKVVPILNEKFPFKSQDGALDYYSRGADQFFLFWGNNVFSYDRHSVIRLLANLPRSIEVLAAIILKIQPTIRLVQTDTNAVHIKSLQQVKRQLFLYFGLIVSATILLTFQIWSFIRAWRSRAVSDTAQAH